MCNVTFRPVVFLLALFTVFFFCGKSDSTAPEEPPEVKVTCVSCHGGRDNTTGAPPRDLNGNFDISSLSIGMHTVHVDSGEVSGGYKCNVCHIIPGEVQTSGHMDDNDGRAEVIFGGIAANDSLIPKWDRETGTCSNIYCHGSFNYAGISLDNNKPKWTKPRENPCGTCHVSDFQTGTACTYCHSRVIGANNRFVDKSKHVNGQIDF